MSKTAKNKPGRTTLGDVASRAGVSLSTASLVLSNKAGELRISEEVHRRVERAAVELDYSPNLLVRSMQSGRTHVLSFFNGFRHRKANDLYMDQLSTALETAAGRLGYDILVHCDFSRSAEGTYRFLNGGLADGLLLFAPAPDDPLLPYLRMSRLPTVLINARDETEGMACVNDDLYDGMRQVAEQLISLGHRRVAAIVSKPGANPEAPLRIGALRGFLQERGVAIPDRWLAPAATREELAEALGYLLAEPEPPTALFCWHDYIGYVILDQCASLGIAVPQQLSVIGYDGLRWPTITGQVLDSVAVDLDLLAASAVELLDGLVNGKEVCVQKMLPVRLMHGTTLCQARP